MPSKLYRHRREKDSDRDLTAVTELAVLAVAAVVSEFAGRVALRFIIAPAVVSSPTGCVSVTAMLSVAHHRSLPEVTFVVRPARVSLALVEEVSAAL